MVPRLRIGWLVVAAIVSASSIGTSQPAYRTLNDRFPPPRYTDRAAWDARATYVRQHVLATAGLLPLPEKRELNATVFGEITRTDYTVAKVHFESFPGFLVTGNLYKPIGDGPFPAVLSPHGHWTYGRLENTSLNSGPGRAIGLARQGFVVFTYDMIGYLDSQQLPHTFGGKRELLWGLSLAGLQLWNSMRAVDFLESLAYVRRDAIGMTGESGGGTQTFLLSAVDPRVAVSVPVNMISLHMQGGCLCENPPSLRLDMTNVEIAATIAPRPLLMISATGDWTRETMELEYPAVRSIYSLFGATDKVHGIRVDADHNYNKPSREAMYAWMARWLKGAPAQDRIEEKSFTPEPLQNLLVFHSRGLPPGAMTAAQLTEYWIGQARRQLESSPATVRTEALQHALGVSQSPGDAKIAKSYPYSRPRTVLLSETNPELEAALKRKGLRSVVMRFTPVDKQAVAKINHFETYNRTPAGQRVADIVTALREHPGAAIVARGDAALAALLAIGIEPSPVAVLDVERFDTSNDQNYVDRLFIPGIRRAGDFQTADDSQRGVTIVHNAGDRFAVKSVDVRAQSLTTNDIVAAITAPAPRQ
jgi:dienelactone hydrolase